MCYRRVRSNNSVSSPRPTTKCKQGDNESRAQTGRRPLSVHDRSLSVQHVHTIKWRQKSHPDNVSAIYSTWLGLVNEYTVSVEKRSNFRSACQYNVLPSGLACCSNHHYFFKNDSTSLCWANRCFVHVRRMIICLSIIPLEAITEVSSGCAVYKGLILQDSEETSPPSTEKLERFQMERHESGTQRRHHHSVGGCRWRNEAVGNRSRQWWCPAHKLGDWLPLERRSSLGVGQHGRCLVYNQRIHESANRRENRLP